MSHPNRMLCATAVMFLASMAFCVAMEADSNPYAGVGKRNIFGLTDPPPPPVDKGPEEDAEPLPDVKVTGTTTVLGIPRALVSVQRRSEVKNYIMIAGDPPVDGVQVLEIKDAPDLDDVRVKVRQNGEDSWLPLEKATPKAAAASAQGQPATQVADARAAARLSAAQLLAARRKAAQQAQVGNSLQRGSPSPAIPTRNVRTAQRPAYGAPALGSGGAATGLQAGGYQVNRTPGKVTRDYGLTSGEQEFLIEANREVSFEDETLGVAPPLPPTPSTPPELDPTIPPEQRLNDDMEPGY